MKFVADTHAVVWHLTRHDRLGRGARRAFEAADSVRSRCYVPAISLVEIALLQEKGRLRVGATRVLEALEGHVGYEVLPLDVAQAIAFGRFSAVRDPMDRLVLSAAHATGSRLVSADEALGAHGVERIWD